MYTSLNNLSFDQLDGELFALQDLQLKGDVLKHTIVPRLAALAQTCIASIHNIYDIDVYQHSTISQYPNFRHKRNSSLDIDYIECFAGLGGKRSPIWQAMLKSDNKQANILPFRFGFSLNQSGIYLKFDNVWLNNFHPKSEKLLLDFLYQYDELLTPLYIESGLKPRFTDTKPILMSTKNFFDALINRHQFQFYLLGSPIKFPISNLELVHLTHQFIIAYPIYECLIRLAQGNKPNLEDLLCHLSNWITATSLEPPHHFQCHKPKDQQIKALEHADSQIKVIPSIRWQVFQRDDWKCVSCGRSSHDGTVLHVDHIIPRSLGGQNHLDNYQTLCHECNIGKSNKDTTNLRNHLTK